LNIFLQPPRQAGRKQGLQNKEFHPFYIAGNVKLGGIKKNPFFVVPVFGNTAQPYPRRDRCCCAFKAAKNTIVTLNTLKITV
jgi:hypothetical protein